MKGFGEDVNESVVLGLGACFNVDDSDVGGGAGVTSDGEWKPVLRVKLSGCWNGMDELGTLEVVIPPFVAITLAAQLLQGGLEGITDGDEWIEIAKRHDVDAG